MNPRITLNTITLPRTWQKRQSDDSEGLILVKRGPHLTAQQNQNQQNQNQDFLSRASNPYSPLTFHSNVIYCVSVTSDLNPANMAELPSTDFGLELKVLSSQRLANPQDAFKPVEAWVCFPLDCDEWRGANNRCRMGLNG